MLLMAISSHKLYIFGKHTQQFFSVFALIIAVVGIILKIYFDRI